MALSKMIVDWASNSSSKTIAFSADFLQSDKLSALHWEDCSIFLDRLREVSKEMSVCMWCQRPSLLHLNKPSTKTTKSSFLLPIVLRPSYPEISSEPGPGTQDAESDMVAWVIHTTLAYLRRCPKPAHWRAGWRRGHLAAVEGRHLPLKGGSHSQHSAGVDSSQEHCQFQ